MAKKSFTKSFLEIAEIIIIALVLSWILRTFVVQANVIPTPSMLPTIQEQDRVLVDKLVFKWTGLHRDDIIVFLPPPKAHSKEDFIKRIIGLPGETLAIKNGKVYINGTALKEPFELQPPDYSYGPVTIPANSYFVMGDNRNNSDDSHAWGFLPKQNIIGRAFIRYWPLTRFGPISS